MPRSPAILAIITLICAGCTGRHPSVPKPAEQTTTQNGPQSNAAVDEYPGFSVNLSLSDKAKIKLEDSKETVIVVGYLLGTAKAGTPEKYFFSPGREIDLGEIDSEVKPGESAHFGPIKLNQDALEHSEKREPTILINVVSGRKSSKDNLLDCGIYEGPLNQIQGATIPIACKLNEGE